MRKIKVVVLLVQQLQHGLTKNAKVSPNLTVAHMCQCLILFSLTYFGNRHDVFDKWAYTYTVHIGPTHYECEFK